MRVSSIRVTATTFVSRIIIAVLTVISNVIIARILGPEGKGFISLALIWPFLLTTAILMGTETAFIYFTSKNQNTLKRFVTLAMVYAMTAGGVTGLAFGTISLWTNLFKSHSAALSIISGAMVPVYVATILVTAAYIGAGRLLLVNSVLVITWTGYVLLLGLLWLISKCSPSLILAAFAGLQVLSLILLLSYSHEKHLFNKSSASPRLDLAVIIRYSLKTYPGSLAGTLQMLALVIVLGLVSSVAEVGLYSVAQSILGALYILPVVVSTVLLPRVASVDVDKGWEITNLASRISLVLTTALAILAGLASVVLIPILFGQSFRHSVVVTLVVLPSALAFNMSKLLTAYFNGISRPGVPSLASLFGFVLLVSLCVILGSRWGALGASLAMSLSSIVVSLWLLGIYSRTVKTCVWNAIVPRASDIQIIWSELSPQHLFKQAANTQAEAAQPAISLKIPPA